MSPKAKRSLLRAEEGARVRVLVRYDASAPAERLRDGFRALGARVLSDDESTHLMGVDVEAVRLGELADLPDVQFVETAERYRS